MRAMGHMSCFAWSQVVSCVLYFDVLGYAGAPCRALCYRGVQRCSWMTATAQGGLGTFGNGPTGQGVDDMVIPAALPFSVALLPTQRRQG